MERIHLKLVADRHEADSKKEREKPLVGDGRLGDAVSREKVETCAYCGSPATRKEHVIARQLLVDKDSPVVVPACDQCDMDKQKYDDYLRDALVLLIETHDAPELKDKHEKAVKSALRTEVISPGRSMLSTFSKETSAGLLRHDTCLSNNFGKVRAKTYLQKRSYFAWSSAQATVCRQIGKAKERLIQQKDLCRHSVTDCFCHANRSLVSAKRYCLVQAKLWAEVGQRPADQIPGIYYSVDQDTEILLRRGHPGSLAD